MFCHVFLTETQRAVWLGQPWSVAFKAAPKVGI